MSVGERWEGCRVSGVKLNTNAWRFLLQIVVESSDVGKALAHRYSPPTLLSR